MSKPYNILNAMPADAFLAPDNFVTDWDTINPHRANEQYESGLKVGKDAKAVCICANGTWAADMRDGSSLTSYEGIGYHAHTSSLLKGFLDSGAKIIVYRKDGNHKVIKEALS